MYQNSGFSLKNCDREVLDIQTDRHTYRGPKQGKPGRNGNSSQGSVLVSGHYWFVKQYWLVNITGLYRVQVSEKYRFLPKRFNIHTEDRNRGNPVETEIPRRARYCLVDITGLQNSPC